MSYTILGSVFGTLTTLLKFRKAANKCITNDETIERAIYSELKTSQKLRQGQQDIGNFDMCLYI